MSYTFPQIKQKIGELGLPSGQYILVGGSALAAHGLRETKDLDIAVVPELFERLVSEGWELDLAYHGKWNRRRVVKDGVEIYPDFYLEKQDRFLDVQTMIDEADIIEGIPLVSLSQLLLFKEDSGREKDLADIALIADFLNSR